MYHKIKYENILNKLLTMFCKIILYVIKLSLSIEYNQNKFNLSYTLIHMNINILLTTNSVYHIERTIYSKCNHMVTFKFTHDFMKDNN